jgi:YYY domain-containing protein
MSSVYRRLDRHLLLLIGIIAVGVFLRTYGMNWDQGIYLHPDERFIAIVSSERVDLPRPGEFTTIFDPASSPLNPRRDGPDGRPLSFAYGTLPVYVQSAVSWGINHFAERDYQSYRYVYKVGRPLNVVMDALTMIFIYLLGRRLFNREAALIATALYAFAVLAIQLSHFFTVDVWLTTFVTASIYMAIRYSDNPTLGRALALSVPVGCAFATKASVPALLLPLAVAGVWALLRSPRWKVTASHLAFAGLLAILIFSIFEPYALVRPRPFFEDIGVQSRIVRGTFDVPFTRQFVGLTPGVYELQNLARYSVGPAFILASLAGVVLAAVQTFRRRSITHAIPLAWIAGYIPTILLTEAKFLRYTLPLLPVFAVFAAGLLTVGLARYGRQVPRIATGVVIAITALWAIGFATIYSSEHPRIAASKWMYANIPAGSAVSVESWDDALPLPYPDAPPMQYRQVSFDIYGDQPPEQKVVTLAESLQSVDYVILSSNRLIDSVDNLPWRYAVQNEYYRRLLDGQLGFQLVYDAELRPSLFGYSYDTSNADESFSVYDHPRVRIFQKVVPLSTDEIRQRLLWGIEQPWIPQRYPDEPTLMLAQPVAEITTTRDVSWNGFAVSSGVVALVSWLLVVEILALAILPLAARIFSRAPDRGAFSARLLGLLLVAWVTWFAASVGLFSMRAVSIWLVVALLAGLTWLGWLRSARPVPLPTIRTYLVGSGIWLAIFGFFIVLRATYPDFWQTWFGGEKPFELAYLRAVSQSTSFPPYDPWFSDGTINYYYYGWHLVGSLTRLSGVGVSHGFQLATATFAALLGLQAAALGALLASRGTKRIRGLPVFAAGGLSVVAILFAGNLDALHQLVTSRALLPEQFDFWRSTRVISYTINEFPYFSQVWADLHPHVINLPILVLLFTLLAHVVLTRELRIERGLILPTLAIALVLGSVGVTNAWDMPLAVGLSIAALAYLGLQRGLLAAAAGASLGIIIVVSSFALFWPFYSGFYSVVEGINRASEGSALGEFLVVWGIFFGVILIRILVDVAARLRDRNAARDGLAFLVLALLAGTGAQVLHMVGNGGLPPRQSVAAILLVALIVSVTATATRPTQLPAILMLGAGGIAAIAGAFVVERPAAAVSAAIAAAASLYAARYRHQPSRFVPWAFAGVAATMLAATEIIYVADDLQRSPWERMNTVFKFHLQAWLLLGFACSVLLARLWVAARVGGAGSASPPGVLGIVSPASLQPSTASPLIATRHQRRVAMSGAVLGTLLLTLGLLYPVAGTRVRLSQDMPTTPTSFTLDGYAWMDGGYILNGTADVITFSGDLLAIEWLNANVSGTPVILEASIGPYRGNGSRISSATGLPTVLGWDRHQRQQRYEAGISQRMAAVRLIYNETDPAVKMELLRRYRVEYVVVGDVERLWNTPENPEVYASEAGLAAFEAMLGNGLTLAFESGATRIYRVDDFPRLPPAPGAVQRL